MRTEETICVKVQRHEIQMQEEKMMKSLWLEHSVCGGVVGV